MSEQSLKVYVYYCINAPNGTEFIESLTGTCGGDINPVSIPCSGKINLPYLVKAFETGADAAVVVTCPSGTCTYLEGNYRAQKRIQAVDSLLQEIGLGAGRLAVVSLEEGDYEKTVEHVREFLGGITPCSQIKTNSSSSVN